jgi:hypothetical protein
MKRFVHIFCDPPLSFVTEVPDEFNWQESLDKIRSGGGVRTDNLYVPYDRIMALCLVAQDTPMEVGGNVIKFAQKKHDA